MTQRIDCPKAAPEALAAMLGLESYVRQCGLPKRLLDLVKMRASQISEKELVDLGLAVIAINGWNRLAIPFRSPVGECEPERT